MFIPDPDFYPSRIQQQHQKSRGKKTVRPAIFVATNIIKLLKNFIFEQVKKFFKAKTLQIIIRFTQKNCQ
jgi:hypothetical protein